MQEVAPGIRLAAACALAIAMALPCAGFAADKPAPKKAHASKAKPDPYKPRLVSDWLKTCQTNETECQIGISEARASFTVTQSLFHDPDYCVTPADDDSKVLAPKVVAWLGSHPGHDKDSEYNGIMKAIGDMYPCAGGGAASR